MPEILLRFITLLSAVLVFVMSWQPCSGRDFCARVPLNEKALNKTTLSETAPGDSISASDSIISSRVRGYRKKVALMADVAAHSLNSAEIRRLGFAELGEALKTLNGLSVRDYGGCGGLSTVSIRGFDSQHTCYLRDGIVISDLQTGSADIGGVSLIRPYSVKLSIGGNEDIFKSAKQQICSGSVELESCEPDFSKRKTHVGLHLGMASFGTWNPHVLYQQKIGKRAYINADVDYLTSRGDYPYEFEGEWVKKRAGSGVSRWRGEFDLKVGLAGGALRAKVLADFAERGLPGPAILHNQNPSEHLSENKTLASLSWDRKLSETLKLKAGINWNRTHTHWSDSSKVYQTPVHEDYRQNLLQSSACLHWQIREWIAVAFAEDFDIAHLETTLPSCPFPTRYSSLSAVSSAFRYRNISLNLCLAAHYIKETVHSGETVPDRFRLSPSASFAWQLPLGFKFRASVRDGYRVPSFNDLYWDRLGNRNLRSEKALQSNMGLAWNRHYDKAYLAISADAFCNRVKDKIVATPTLFVWRMHNIGRALISGLDLNAEANYDIHSNIKIHAKLGYELMYALDISDKTAANYKHQIRYIPRNSANGSISIDSKWLRVSYIALAVGKRWYHDQNTPRTVLQPYWDHSISIGRDFSLPSHVRLGISAEAMNLSDKNYEIVRSYPMPGRRYRLSIRLTL